MSWRWSGTAAARVLDPRTGEPSTSCWFAAGLRPGWRGRPITRSWAGRNLTERHEDHERRLVRGRFPSARRPDRACHLPHAPISISGRHAPCRDRRRVRRVRTDYDLNPEWPAPRKNESAGRRCWSDWWIGGDDYGVVLTLRPETMTNHAGQVAFPGGRIEPGEASRFAAALREAYEEVGVDPGNCERARAGRHLSYWQQVPRFRRNRETAAGKIGVALPYDAHGPGIDADLLVRLAQGGGERGVSRFDPAAGKGHLPGMAAHGVGPEREEDVERRPRSIRPTSTAAR